MIYASDIPRIYFAGKISSNDWRHDIVPDGNLRGAVCTDDAYEDKHLFNPAFTLDCRGFIYGGPFFVSCDHGCFHGPNNHGTGIVENGCGCGDDPVSAGNIASRRKMIFDINAKRLRRASRVFAYVETADCYGTLIELGMASAHGIPIAIGFSPDLPLAVRDDLWMAAQSAEHVYIGSAVDCWEEFAREHLDIRRFLLPRGVVEGLTAAFRKRGKTNG